MNADYIPAINVIEKNPYAPRPFVFTEMAVCLRDAIRAAGFRSEHLVNRIDPEAWSIVLGGRPEFHGELDHLDPRRCAIFNFEQLGSDSQLVDLEYLGWLASWLVLDYHGRNVEVLKRTNGLGQQALELPVLPSPLLVSTGPEERNVDVLFYGTMNDRRAKVLADLEKRGLRTEVVAGAYGPELSPAIRRARLVLHVHYYDTGLFPVARVLQPAATGVPVVCENSVFSPMNDWSCSGIVFCGYQDLADTCQSLLRNPEGLSRSASRVLQFCSRVDFAKPLQAVITAMAANATSPPEPWLGGSTLYGSGLAELEDNAGGLSNEQIEDLLIREGAQMPEAHVSTEPLAVARREPGQAPIGKVLIWISIAVMVLGSLRYWLDGKA